MNPEPLKKDDIKLAFDFKSRERVVSEEKLKAAVEWLKKEVAKHGETSVGKIMIV